MYLRLTHSNPVTVNDLETITNGMADSWGTNFTPQITTNVALTQIAASFITGAGTSLDYVHTETKTGTAANAVQNVATCVVVNWQIGDYYRGGHPRSYMPGPNSAAITNGSTLTAAYGASFAAAATAWLNAVNALTSTNITQTELGTVRYESGGNWLSPPVFKPFQSSAIRSVLGTQRRRLTE